MQKKFVIVGKLQRLAVLYGPRQLPEVANEPRLRREADILPSRGISPLRLTHCAPIAR